MVTPSLSLSYSFLVDPSLVKEIVMRQFIDVFMLINPRSGSRKGQKILEAEFKAVEMDFDSNHVKVHIADLTDVEQKSKLLKKMKQIQSESRAKAYASPIGSNLTTGPLMPT